MHPRGKKFRQIQLKDNGGLSGATSQATATRDENNTSLFITNLPPNCTVTHLLASIRGCGKIYSAGIVRPTLSHATAAAKLIFFDKEGAKKFYELSGAKQWKVNDHLPIVVPNRVPTQSQPDTSNSRVIGIWGPKDVINRDYLEGKVFSTFYYHLTKIIVHYEEDDFRIMEFHFGSFHKQAESAMERIRSFIETPNLTEGERALWVKVTAIYLSDPCA
ncbi:hypothetical protein K449DRAFT_430245 [Hypoxylon sp. EC38]|nr:hypothetical protein K449DRAFT_430245 [Hypoxylon sp. EC38]